VAPTSDRPDPDLSALGDDELLARLRRGDCPAARVELLVRYHDRACRLLAAKAQAECLTAEEFEDLRQETALALLAVSDRFAGFEKAGGGSFDLPPFLALVALRRFRKYLRGRRRAARLLDRSAAVEEVLADAPGRVVADPSALAVRQETFARLAEGLGLLTATQRRLCEGHAEGRPLRRLALELNLSESKARRLRRAAFCQLRAHVRGGRHGDAA
jgi:RNA polymerase sigma factor (sigma-70 family)